MNCRLIFIFGARCPSDEQESRYGLHAANTALMTCLVLNLQKSEHIHFIDGGDGGDSGFAIAEKQMKAQLAGGGRSADRPPPGCTNPTGKSKREDRRFVAEEQ